MKRILLTGIHGQVGQALQHSLAGLGQLIALDRQALDLSNRVAIEQALAHYQPDIIVNPAAYTAVDQAEAEPELADAINHHAPAVMAQWAHTHQALLVHYSTDYVFDGTLTRPYREDDACHPPSVYGKSKWQGEQAIQHSGCQYLLLRTSWVFSQHGHNFLKTILRLAQERSELKIVADQYGAPTSARLIAQVSTELLQQYLQSDRPTQQCYHLTAQGHTSWHGYAQSIVRHAQALGVKLALPPEAILPINTDQYPLPAPRPANSRLDCGKLEQVLGRRLPPWEEDVLRVLQALNLQTG